MVPWVPEGFFPFGVIYKIPNHFEVYFSPLRFKSLAPRERKKEPLAPRVRRWERRKQKFGFIKRVDKG